MALYAIGDLQGCYDELQSLLDRIRFDPSCDRLWFCGDLVNRGPSSLETLRFIRDLGDSAVTVLGNHDLHLLAVSQGVRPFKKRSDTFNDILEADDRDELIDWLRRRPLLHFDRERNLCMVHAGMPPQWDIDLALECAREVELRLQGEAWVSLLEMMYGNSPELWSPSLRGDLRLRYTINALTRLRYCYRDGALALKYKGKPGSQPADCVPWFEHPARPRKQPLILFGHWSTLGLYLEHNVACLDSGCLWGGALSALRLDGSKPELFEQPCDAHRLP